MNGFPIDAGYGYLAGNEPAMVECDSRLEGELAWPPTASAEIIMQTSRIDVSMLPLLHGYMAIVSHTPTSRVAALVKWVSGVQTVLGTYALPYTAKGLWLKIKDIGAGNHQITCFTKSPSGPWDYAVNVTDYSPLLAPGQLVFGAQVGGSLPGPAGAGDVAHIYGWDGSNDSSFLYPPI
jgi:hypothetical protein